MGVYEYCLEGSSWTENYDNSITAEVSFIVTGLSQIVNPHLKIQTALSQVPDRSDQFPDIANLRVTDRRVEGIAEDAVRVVCTYYKPSDLITLSFSGGSVNDQTNKDFEGKPMTVTYSGADTDFESATQYGEVEGGSPSLNINMTRILTFPVTLTYPGESDKSFNAIQDFILEYLNKVNETPFFSAQVRQYYCSRVDAQPVPRQYLIGGPNSIYTDTYEIQMDWQYKPNEETFNMEDPDTPIVVPGWDITLAWTDYSTGRIPPTRDGQPLPRLGDGFQNYQVARTSTFRHPFGVVV